MVLNSDGLVLTNNHVIENATGITATVLATGKTYPAKVLGYDETGDVAAIQLQGASGLHTIPVGDSTAVKTGDSVLAMGNAEGESAIRPAPGSVTGVNQSITASDEGGSITTEKLHGMIETNADIVSGDSGGALANSSANAPPGAPSGILRAVNAFRALLPFVQRILPLLDGNIGTAVSNVLGPHHHPAPPPPPVNLAPITESLAELQAQHSELRDQVIEQNTSLKRVEDQLGMVREATDRNTLEQQELMEDLKAVGSKVNLVAIVAIVLLAASLALNVLLYLHVRRVLP